MNLRPDYYYRQSAVIPFREGENGPEIMVITSRKKKRWVVPKGIIEPDLSPHDSAAKEAEEEAGVRGEVNPQSVGEYQYEKWGGTCTVSVFVMQVTEVMDHWPESHRDREWISREEAAERMTDAGMRKIMQNAPLSV